jgi:hypothetical protein
MPDTIMRTYDSPTHWVIDRIGVGHGKTACGVTIKGGITGASIVTFIDCKRCQAALRKAGWTTGPESFRGGS